MILNIISRLNKLKNTLFKGKIHLNKNFDELLFIVLITSYNNEKYCQRNLKSVLNQNYSNFNVIYIDDYSFDNTTLIVENFINKYDKNNQISLIKNKVRKKKLKNLYEIIQTVPDNTIILELDGDDYLAHENVLKLFNIQFQSKNAWIVHSSYINNPPELAKNLEIFSQKTPNFIIKNNWFRSYPWIYSGIRAYYAGLFKKIKIEDLQFKYEFFPVSHDRAMFYPMLEMASEKVGYINEPLLIRNISEINDFKVYDSKLRQEINKEITNAKKYSKIEQIF